MLCIADEPGSSGAHDKVHGEPGSSGARECSDDKVHGDKPLSS